MIHSFHLLPAMKENLKEMVAQRDADISFREDPQLAGLVASLGIHQEVGTVNDELTRHLFDKETGKPISLSSMTSELITWKGQWGVRIWSKDANTLSIHHSQLIHLLHPEFSKNRDGEFCQLVVFPQSIAQIIAMQEIDLVIVRDWALNTVFGGFDEDSRFYVTNEWEIFQNDGLRMAKMMSQRKLAFFGTHDLVAHVAGADGHVWRELKSLADQIIPTLSCGHSEAINHLVVPYLIGVLLDDLAQPDHYRSRDRLETIRTLVQIQKWIVRHLIPKKKLHQFPKAFSELIERTRQRSYDKKTLSEDIKKLSLELQVFSDEKVASF